MWSSFNRIPSWLWRLTQQSRCLFAVRLFRARPFSHDHPRILRITWNSTNSTEFHQTHFCFFLIMHTSSFHTLQMSLDKIWLKGINVKWVFYLLLFIWLLCSCSITHPKCQLSSFSVPSYAARTQQPMFIAPDTMFQKEAWNWNPVLSSQSKNLLSFFAPLTFAFIATTRISRNVTAPKIPREGSDLLHRTLRRISCRLRPCLRWLWFCPRSAGAACPSGCCLPSSSAPGRARRWRCSRPCPCRRSWKRLWCRAWWEEGRDRIGGDGRDDQLQRNSYRSPDATTTCLGDRKRLKDFTLSLSPLHVPKRCPCQGWGIYQHYIVILIWYFMFIILDFGSCYILFFLFPGCIRITCCNVLM